MVTPLRRQYLEVKRQFPDTIVFFRLGDFYETFDQDARVTAQALEITLTSREMGKGHRVPMAGIPYHALDSYLSRLLTRGHKVAICEQLGAPGREKGLVERDVVRVVTPGTVVEPGLLQAGANNYLASLALAGDRSGLAYVDITTSEFAATELPLAGLLPELERLKPAEVLVAQQAETPGLPSSLVLTRLDDLCFDIEEARQALLQHFGVATLEGFGCGDLPLAIRAAGAIIAYLEKSQKAALPQLTRLSTYSTQGFMTLDSQTRRNLELFQAGREADRAGSLLSLLDECRTSPGSRLLRRWLGQPLLDVAELERRLDAVEWLCQNAIPRATLASLLKRVSDIERVVNRVRAGSATPREVVALSRSLEALPQVRDVLQNAGDLGWLLAELRPCPEVVGLINSAVSQEPGATLAEGGVIREGFSAELDRLRLASRDARQYLAGLEREERERTGIRSLKVGYNRVFGYYIEITRAHLDRVPSDYIRKQTLAEAERFFTPRLKEYESLILTAQERMLELETDLFRQVCQQVAASAEQVLSSAQGLARLDVFVALADVAQRHGYVRPRLSEGRAIRIVAGRHPAVERALEGGAFIPNDTYLSCDEAQVIILTGPNMSGKSTYLRQVALIVLMAQIGSFVPAEAADIGLVDRIFTRIGLQDDLSTGRSTFMVEMIETASILNNATPRSLIILDEIGRGTSTYDGLSIARAVAEFIHNQPRLGAKTLFATHYHELVSLADSLPRAKNFNVAVSEDNGRVVFLRKVVPGGADKSYGIHVAQLAGLPRSVTRRAAEVLADLERDHRTSPVPVVPGRRREAPREQLPLLLHRPDLAAELLKLDVDSMTPLEAITRLYELQRKAKDSV